MVQRIAATFPGQDFTHLWRSLGSSAGNPMGVHWTGVVFGWGIAISFGYWTTDFLVVQRVMSAKDLRSAQMGTIIGGFFKLMVPVIVILPGLLALAVLPFKLVPETMTGVPGAHTYNEALPLMLARYCGPGLLGLGVTALIAGFMSGMAGNVSAFATIWTYDIYKPLIRKRAREEHYLEMGRWCSLLGVVVSIGTAYLVMNFSSIIVYAQAIRFFHCAHVWHCNSRNDLETHDPGCRLLGIASWHRDCRHVMAVGEDGSVRTPIRCLFAGRQRYGRERLSIDVDLNRQFVGDGDNNHGYETEAGP